MGAFTLRYGNTINGAITFTGNTAGLSKEEGTNNAGTEHSIGAYISTNTSSNVPTYATNGSTPTNNNSGSTLYIYDNLTATPPQYANGSFAFLNLPFGSVVEYVDLIWAGSYISGPEDNSAFINNPVSVTVYGTTTTTKPISPEVTYTNGSNPAYYLNVAKITSTDWPELFALTDGSYKIACKNIVGTTNPDDETNNACGWTLCVVYSSATLPSRNITLYSGNGTTFVGAGNTVTSTASGFETPTSGSVNGRILVTALEGDAVLTGDQAAITDSSNVFHNLSGPNNLVNNFFASQINNDAGFLDTTGSFGNYNQDPDGTNFPGCRQGWDITNVNANPFPFVNLNNGQTSTTVQCTSSGDRYWVTGLGIQLDVNAPLLQIVKLANKSTAVLNDVIQYEIRITNTGTATAYDLLFDDDVPPNTTYVTNSVSVTGANADISGFPTSIIINSPLAPGATPIIIKYSVKVTTLPPTRTIVNFSDITYSFDGPGGKTLKGNAQSNSVTTSLTAPLPPAVPNYSVETCKNGQVAGTVVGMDIDGNYPLQYLIFKRPNNGFVSIDINTGKWHYTPKAGFVGVDSFQVVVLDSQGAAAVSTITITVLDIPCCEFRCKQCGCNSNCCK